MLFFNFSRIFRLKGISKPYTYVMNLGYGPTLATKMCNGKVGQINLDRLEQFCTDFNCTPNDLIDFSLSPKQKLPADHALHSLTKKEISDAVMAKINAMSVDKIQQIHDIIKNME